MTDKIEITVETTIKVPVEKVWKYFIEPKHLKLWCFASDDWHLPDAKNDLRTGGRFINTMAAKDGSMSFDFTGTYTSVQEPNLIEYIIDDGRKVKINFTEEKGETIVTETFEAENINSIEMQKGGWQAILDNFKKYTETN